MGGFGGDREASGKTGCRLPVSRSNPLTRGGILEIVRSNIRFSLQPVDAPPDPAILNRLFDHMQLDELILFSTDYSHWYDRLKIVARETTP